MLLLSRRAFSVGVRVFTGLKKVNGVDKEVRACVGEDFTKTQTEKKEEKTVNHSENNEKTLHKNKKENQNECEKTTKKKAKKSKKTTTQD